MNSTPDAREAALNEMQTLGVDIVKITIEWNKLAPAGATKPAGFDGSAARRLQRGRRGRATTPRSTGPRHAACGRSSRSRAPHRSGPRQRSNPPGVQRPDATEFAQFAQAVGAKYPGVTMWSV